MRTQGTMSIQNHTKRLLIILVGLSILICGVFIIQRTLSFHIVKTDPKLSAVGNYSPFMKVYFSKDVTPKGLVVTSTNHIIKNTQVSGKVLTIQFASKLDVNKTYTVTLQYIGSKTGSTIEGKQLVFVAQNIPISKFSKGQQQALIQKQDTYPYSVYTVPFNGFDVLTDNGLSADQLQVVKRAIYDYSVLVNQQFKSVTLQQQSLSVAPYDPNSADLSHSLMFIMLADATKYTVSVTYDDLTTAHVVITDVVGTTVFDNTAH